MYLHNIITIIVIRHLTRNKIFYLYIITVKMVSILSTNKI